MVSLRGNRFHSSKDMARGEAKQKQTNKQTPLSPLPVIFSLLRVWVATSYFKRLPHRLNHGHKLNHNYSIKICRNGHHALC